jgi:hypothetical protein
MDSTQFLKTRVPAQTKLLVRAAAEREFLTEAIWFRRAIERALVAGASAAPAAPAEPFQDGRRSGRDGWGRGARLYVRLRPDDRLLLRERAAARGMPAATYVSVLTRSHLHSLPPLPKDELLALKRAVAELGAIGRNLNQIARAANQGARSAAPSREDIHAILKVCEGLRDHTKALIKANTDSWEIGHAEVQD